MKISTQGVILERGDNLRGVSLNGVRVIFAVGRDWRADEASRSIGERDVDDLLCELDADTSATTALNNCAIFTDVSFARTAAEEVLRKAARQR